MRVPGFMFRITPARNSRTSEAPVGSKCPAHYYSRLPRNPWPICQMPLYSIISDDPGHHHCPSGQLVAIPGALLRIPKSRRGQAETSQMQTEGERGAVSRRQRQLHLYPLESSAFSLQTTLIAPGQAAALSGAWKVDQRIPTSAGAEPSQDC
jgi:hypothetical protein